MTLLQLAPEHQSAVIELGANRVGEIAYTVALTRPQVAIITNAGTAHVGEFGGQDKIVLAKGEILEGLAADGVAILNRDDKASIPGRPVLTAVASPVSACTMFAPTSTPATSSVTPVAARDSPCRALPARLPFS